MKARKIMCVGIIRLTILLITLGLGACASAPHQSSSYSAENIFREDVKDYPYIKLASRAAPEGIAEFKNLIYAQRATQALQLDLYAPATTMDELRPGIVLVHGGDWLAGTREHVVPLAIQFALRGYVVAVIQYRLAPHAPYPAAVEDTQAAVSWLREHAGQYGIDASHIAVGGVGAGGTIAALAGLMKDHDTERNETAKAQVIFSFDSPWQLDAAPLKSETGHSDPLSVWLSQAAVSLPQLRHQVSPANQIRKDMPAVFLLNSGDQSYRVGQDEVIRRLNHFRVPHRVEHISHSSHHFWLFDPWVGPAASITADFLDLQFKYRMTCH